MVDEVLRRPSIIRSGYLAEVQADATVPMAAIWWSVVAANMLQGSVWRKQKTGPANKTRGMPRDELLKPWTRDSAGPNSVLPTCPP